MKHPAAILLLAALPISGVQADSLGRLFFTPAQRMQLEREHAQQAGTEDQKIPLLILNGIVQESDGARTVWINGIARNADGNGSAPDTHTLTAPGISRPMKFKVGQRMVPERAAAQ